ncbi:MAG: hypothetical protein CVT65_05875 [Actinobacteria bacterium HGW-Actinobacteria-5]|nr:MAG: hypothetical protein CVT65_05875 [Actinobacteria bacterium HGW-Actinobacteria-5]
MLAVSGCRLSSFTTKSRRSLVFSAAIRTARSYWPPRNSTSSTPRQPASRCASSRSRGRAEACRRTRIRAWIGQPTLDSSMSAWKPRITPDSISAWVRVWAVDSAT